MVEEYKLFSHAGDVRPLTLGQLAVRLNAFRRMHKKHRPKQKNG